VSFVSNCQERKFVIQFLKLMGVYFHLHDKTVGMRF
jgi:hypothetical protein